MLIYGAVYHHWHTPFTTKTLIFACTLRLCARDCFAYQAVIVKHEGFRGKIWQIWIKVDQTSVSSGPKHPLTEHLMAGKLICCPQPSALKNSRLYKMALFKVCDSCLKKRTKNKANIKNNYLIVHKTRMSKVLKWKVTFIYSASWTLTDSSILEHPPPTSDTLPPAVLRMKKANKA